MNVKKFVCCLLLVALVAALCCQTAVFAEVDQTTIAVDVDLYGFVTEFVSSNTERGDETAEKEAASWLKTEFDKVLPSGTTSNVERVSQSDEYAYNVVARVGKGSQKQIIVGAHYDAVKHSAGITDNACGVAVLYGVMKGVSEKLQTSSAEFDVVFVAFGGEERGLLGSQGFVDRMSDAQKKNTLLMINLDSVGGGDQLYLHCENKHTDIADYLTNLSDGKITEKPYRKGVYNTFDTYGYGYYEAIQGSDHTPFRLAGIPVAFFFSGNYDNFDYEQSSDESNCVMNTSADSLAHAEKIKIMLSSQMNVVCEVVVTALSDEQFNSVANGACKQIVNLDIAYGTLYPKLVALAVVIVCALLFIPYYRKLQKRAIMGTAEVKTTRVFNQPDADDIFTFDDKK